MIDANEELVRTFSNSLIVRLPGIWGFRKYNNMWMPSGLIAHLLNAAITRQEALIFGNLHTTRHYLSSESVGNSIAKMIYYSDWSLLKGTQNLYSSALFSISNIISLINYGISKKVYYRIMPGAFVDREDLIRKANEGLDVVVLNSLLFEIRAECLRLQQVSL
jgi:hypothetical protein